MPDFSRMEESLKKNGGRYRRDTRRNRAYSRFFEGYSEYAEPVSGGKRNRIVRVYTADYYKADLSRAKQNTYRILYLLFFLAATGVFVWTATERTVYNLVLYVILCQAACVFFLTWTGLALFRYLFSDEMKTAFAYKKSSGSMIRGTTGCMIAFSALALAYLAALVIVFKAVNTDICIAGMVRCLFCAACAFCIRRMEKGVLYLRIPSNQTVPEEHFEI